MKKRGYTLIELIAVMAIFLILVGGGFTIINMLNNVKKKLELESVVYEVNSILSYAKTHCRKNSRTGEVVIDTVRNTINFRSLDENNRSVVIKSEKLPNNIKITSQTIYLNIINVSNTGYLKNSGTISLDNGDRKKYITIAVGNDLISLKDGTLVEDRENLDEITAN